MCVAYVGIREGQASGAKEGVFFFVFLSSSVLPRWIHHHHQEIGEKRCCERGASCCGNILIFFRYPSPFLFFFSCSYKRVHYIASRPGEVEIRIRSLFFVQKMKEADKKERLLLLLHLYIHNLFFLFGLWHFPWRAGDIGCLFTCNCCIFGTLYTTFRCRLGW